MFNRNRDEEDRPIWPVFVAGFLSIVLGVFLGFLSLANQQVREVNIAPNPDKVEPGEVYYLLGSSGGGAAWRSKRGAFLAESVKRISLTEGELNQWAKAELVADAPKTPNGEEPPKEGFFSSSFTGYNFRFGEDYIQIGGNFSFPKLLPGNVFVCQVRGRFENGPQGPEFKVYEGYMGKAPIGKIPFVRVALEKIMRSDLSKISEAAEVRSALKTFSTIELSGGQLVFQRG